MGNKGKIGYQRGGQDGRCGTYSKVFKSRPHGKPLPLLHLTVSSLTTSTGGLALLAGLLAPRPSGTS